MQLQYTSCSERATQYDDTITRQWRSRQETTFQENQ
ncbi:Uncharacterised protein [Vibrio cholerae]|nr:Uncharacterised protein [Vibrio cholerae]